jgi:oligosaccharide translocation protein RFT1
MTPSFASSASLLVGLQLGSRLFTFALNQALLRFVSPQAFGTVAIQFELLSSTILFLSREGFRNSLLRAWNSTESKDGKLADVRPSVVNLALLPAAVGIPISVLACLVYHQSCGYETRQQSYFDVAVAIYAIASSLELLSEPFHIR